MVATITTSMFLRITLRCTRDPTKTMYKFLQISRVKQIIMNFLRTTIIKDYKSSVRIPEKSFSLFLSIIKKQNGDMYFYDQYQFEDPNFLDARKNSKKRGRKRKNNDTEDYPVL